MVNLETKYIDKMLEMGDIEGIRANDLKHFIKKMGDKKFSEWQKGERPTKNTLF